MGRLKDRIRPQQEADDTPYQEPDSYEPYNDKQDYEPEIPPIPGPQQPMSIPIPPSPRVEEKQYYEPERTRLSSGRKLREEMEMSPIKKGYMQINLAGIPVDAHALEEYILTATSPKKISNLMSLVKRASVDEYRSLAPTGKKMKGSTLVIILAIAGIGIAGVMVLMFMPEILKILGAG